YQKNDVPPRLKSRGLNRHSFFGCSRIHPRPKGRGFLQNSRHKKDLSLQIVLYWHKKLFEKTKPDAAGKTTSVEELSNPFLYLLLAQGFFAGLTIGKLAEGTMKAGIKHSFIMTVTAFLVSTGVRLAFS
ncbi:hypothetical protein HYW75_01430, partial [Candidatus Pacearchaeota archaeon]|nr:hypothetical protein [Candidatus Pacearchaeota archaeon]